MSINRKLILCSLILLGVVTISYAKISESFFQHQWCLIEGGQTKYTLPDRTRIDCHTESHAVEVDFAHKWAEAIGQSLHYSLMSGIGKFDNGNGYINNPYHLLCE